MNAGPCRAAPAEKRRDTFDAEHRSECASALWTLSVATRANLATAWSYRKSECAAYADGLQAQIKVSIGVRASACQSLLEQSCSCAGKQLAPSGIQFRLTVQMSVQPNNL